MINIRPGQRIKIINPTEEDLAEVEGDAEAADMIMEVRGGAQHGEQTVPIAEGAITGDPAVKQGEADRARELMGGTDKLDHRRIIRIDGVQRPETVVIVREGALIEIIKVDSPIETIVT